MPQAHNRCRYLEDLRKHLKELKKAKPPKGDKHDRKKEQKRLETKRQHMKVLIKYVDKDYAETKNRYVPSPSHCAFLYYCPLLTLYAVSIPC